VDWEVLGIALLIVLARMGDVSLGTLRTVCVVQGRRKIAIILSFFEVLLWVSVVAQVVGNLTTQPIYGLSYALGYSLGCFLGMTIEKRLAMGDQVVRVFTQHGSALATTLRQEGYRVTEFEGKGRDGPITLLFLQVSRRTADGLAQKLHALDPSCYYVVDDIRAASSVLHRLNRQAGTWTMFNRK
jgi:uncharacterized protein YebE (UPF0316 family)